MSFITGLIPQKVKKLVKQQLGVPSLTWSLQNLKRNGFHPEFIVDAGAYKGEWSLETSHVFPGAEFLMLEAQDSKRPFLEKLCKQNRQLNYAIALLGAVDNQLVYFDENETGSHVLDGPEEARPTKQLLTSTLDTIVLSKGNRLPDFIKLDVQGFEIEVLKGAAKSLAQAEVCLLEVSLLNLGDHDPVLHDVVNFMNEKDFQAYDISQFMRRPFDKALHQVDMFFVSKKSKLVSSKRW